MLLFAIPLTNWSQEKTCILLMEKSGKMKTVNNGHPDQNIHLAENQKGYAPGWPRAPYA